jgi:hypothetical protein
MALQVVADASAGWSVWLLLAAGVAALVWCSVDLWRTTAYPASGKVGWQVLLLAGPVGPSVAAGDGWYVGVPLGVVVYLLAARQGPLRRRRRTESRDASRSADVASGR